MMNMLIGLPWRIRTSDLWFRRPALYPAELKAGVSPDPEENKMKGWVRRIWSGWKDSNLHTRICSPLRHLSATPTLTVIFSISFFIISTSIIDDFFCSHLRHFNSNTFTSTVGPIMWIKFSTVISIC